MDNNELKRKTKLVIIVDLITMFSEIFFGIITNSMALTADGFHMGTHVLALSITYIVCIFITKYKEKEKILNAIGGYTSAILLLLTSFFIFYESLEKLIKKETIYFNEAILVAIIGLVVNVVCILLMKDNHIHHDHHKHQEHGENLNFKSAYLHILTDALTSIIAIVALLLGKYFNLIFLDPLIGILGAIIILKWSINLIKESLKILIN